tara:strand:- start:146 stop:376 length:231 start_codon:yes stop_codon:yes gene_type:complete
LLAVGRRNPYQSGIKPYLNELGVIVENNIPPQLSFTNLFTPTGWKTLWGETVGRKYRMEVSNALLLHTFSKSLKLF